MYAYPYPPERDGQWDVRLSVDAWLTDLRGDGDIEGGFATGKGGRADDGWTIGGLLHFLESPLGLGLVMCVMPLPLFALVFCSTAGVGNDDRAKKDK